MFKSRFVFANHLQHCFSFLSINGPVTLKAIPFPRMACLSNKHICLNAVQKLLMSLLPLIPSQSVANWLAYDKKALIVQHTAGS